MALTNVYVKNFDNKEQAMAFKHANNLPVYIYDENRWLFMTIDDNLDGELLDLESLDTSLLVEDPTDPRYCKLYRYIDVANTSEYEAPRGHNYVLGLSTKLYPVRVFKQGELQSVHWYGDLDKTDLILKVEVVYQRDPLGFATFRTTTRTWIREDGTEHENVKISIKEYDQLAQIKEGIRRRGNIVDGLQIPVLGMMVATVPNMSQTDIILMGRDFLKAHQSAFMAFIHESNATILQAVQDATDDWLDNVIDANGTTIRMYILNELNIY